MNTGLMILLSGLGMGVGMLWIVLLVDNLRNKRKNKEINELLKQQELNKSHAYHTYHMTKQTQKK